METCYSALGLVPPLFLKSFLSHKDQKPDEGAVISAGLFVQQSQSNKNKWNSPWLFALSKAECCSGFLSGNCMLKSCIFQCLEATGRGSVRCSLACQPPRGAFFIGLPLFLVWDQHRFSQPIQGTLVWCSEASHTFGPWILALRLWVLTAFRSEILNWAATAVLILAMREIVSKSWRVCLQRNA